MATLRSTGRPTVIDFKTQKVRRDKDGRFKPILHDTWPLQLEAYRQALALRDRGLENAAIASVVIGSTEPVPVEFKPWDDADKPACFQRLPRRPRPLGLAEKLLPDQGRPAGRPGRVLNPKLHTKGDPHAMKFSRSHVPTKVKVTCRVSKVTTDEIETSADDPEQAKLPL